MSHINDLINAQMAYNTGQQPEKFVIELDLDNRDTLAEIAALRRNGDSQAQIAKKMFTNRGFVCKALSVVKSINDASFEALVDNYYYELD